MDDLIRHFDVEMIEAVIDEKTARYAPGTPSVSEIQGRLAEMQLGFEEWWVQIIKEFAAHPNRLRAERGNLLVYAQLSGRVAEWIHDHLGVNVNDQTMRILLGVHRRRASELVDVETPIDPLVIRKPPHGEPENRHRKATINGIIDQYGMDPIEAFGYYGVRKQGMPVEEFCEQYSVSESELRERLVRADDARVYPG